jgi:hypothetical protein
VIAGGAGEVAQGSLHCEDLPSLAPWTRWVFDAVAATPSQHAGVVQLVDRGSHVTQRGEFLTGRTLEGAVVMLLGEGNAVANSPVSS